MKKEEITISLNAIPPTILEINDGWFTIKYGKNIITISREDAKRLVYSLKQYLIA